MKCKICERKADRNVYCESHTKTYENIVKKYDEWEKALEISWEEYLSKIIKNPSTGKWAKEVAEYLTREGEKKSVT